MKHLTILPVLILVLATFSMGYKDGGAQIVPIPFDETKIIIEVNDTDGDAGIQVFIDGEAWKEVTIVSPDGNIFDTIRTGNLGGLGLTKLFFESEEPSFVDFPLEEFLALFPEGEYEFRGETVDGDELVGASTLTHVLPCGPEILMPAEGAVLDPDVPVVIDWDPVTNELDPLTAECQDQESPRLEIVGYEVIIERVVPEPLLEFSEELPASTTMVTARPEFVEPGAQFKFEVLAIEESGNQTITESFFCTAPLTPCPEPE